MLLGPLQFSEVSHLRFSRIYNLSCCFQVLVTYTQFLFRGKKSYFPHTWICSSDEFELNS
ncbi:hypothetical protein X975_15291, partial [Stegodyphus mimosarum]